MSSRALVVGGVSLLGLAVPSTTVWGRGRVLRPFSDGEACGGARVAASTASSRARPAGHPAKLYISNQTEGTVVVVDAATGAIEATIPVGKRPRGLRLSRDGTRLFVALSGSPIAGPGVDESKLPPPDRSADGIGVVNLATRKTLYTANGPSGDVSFVNVENGKVERRVSVGGSPWGVVLSH